MSIVCSVALLLVVSAPPKATLTPETRKLLDKADTIELISLDPRPETRDKKDKKFHDYKELGRVKLTKKADREAVLKALYKGVDDSKGLVAGCFKPRHGIVAVVDGKKVELVICYECYSMTVHVDGKRSSALTVPGPEKVFNKILSDAKVPLPKPPG